MSAIAINGFGRIGRAICRIALERKIPIKAINDLTSPKNAAYLLKYDSIYGPLKDKISSTKNSLIINGKKIPYLQIPDPEKLPWKSLKISTVIECTGSCKNKSSALKHLEAGASKIIITAPFFEADITIVPGVNSKSLSSKHKIISLASCTTNALAPTLSVLDEKFKVKRAFFTTTHAYTNNQKLVDTGHEKPRRGRAAAINIVPTTTGASKATTLVLPQLKGKLSGFAIRVPVPTGSLIDLTVEISKPHIPQAINSAFKKSASSKLKGILQYTEDDIVSSDIVGNPHSAIISAIDTQTTGNLVKVLAWYDNEYGYSNRVLDVIKMLR
jgi:glyceraldehyde 3-phosphate dehydrogenase